MKASKLQFNVLEKARPKVGESDRETVMILKYETKEMDYLRWISKERKNERKELWEFYPIDDQKDQEIVECEINNFQIIRLSEIGES